MYLGTNGDLGDGQAVLTQDLTLMGRLVKQLVLDTVEVVGIPALPALLSAGLRLFLVLARNVRPDERALRSLPSCLCTVPAA